MKQLLLPLLVIALIIASLLFAPPLLAANGLILKAPPHTFSIDIILGLLIIIGTAYAGHKTHLKHQHEISK